MARLAAWSMYRKGGKAAARPPAPRRIECSHVEFEKHVEDWIANDVPLIGKGLTLVGRQARAVVILRECRLAGVGGADP